MKTDVYVTPLSNDGPDTEGFAFSNTSREALHHWSETLSGVVFNEKTLSESSRWARSGMRRALECCIAATGLVFMLPVISAAAVLVLFDTEGPIFFRQKRMGRNGREFTLYKFRSMTVTESGGTQVTAACDSRITRSGGFLRRYKLDELPQLWNVVRGDMSLVGPRPKLPHLEPLHMTYRPGITGAATLVFRNEEELLARVPQTEIESYYEACIKPAKARLDLDYMRQSSFLSDVGILWRTAAGCIFSHKYNDLTAEEAIERCMAVPAEQHQRVSAPPASKTRSHNFHSAHPSEPTFSGLAHSAQLPSEQPVAQV